MANQDDAPQLLTPDDVAAHLKMHRDTVRRLLRAGDLPGVKIGRAWRVSSDKLAKWVDDKGANK